MTNKNALFKKLNFNKWTKNIIKQDAIQVQIFEKNYKLDFVYIVRYNPPPKGGRTLWKTNRK